MRIAFSNLAWEVAQDELAAQILAPAGVRGVELAPSKVWSRPFEVSSEDLTAYSRWWISRSLQPVALQALLYGRPDLVLFGSSETRADLGRYLLKMAQLASSVGATRMVFGSPTNRKRAGMSKETADLLAAEFFSRLGDQLADLGVVLCLEPNPPVYGCDWLTNAAEGRHFVSLVGNQAIQLQLDTGAMELAGDAQVDEVATSIPVLRHMHLSAPSLRPVDVRNSDHQAVAGVLREAGYSEWVSVEMLPGDEAPLDAITRAATSAVEVYG